VYRALVEAPALMRWFCEHADISLPAKRYDFWGRFTPEAPDHSAGQHALLDAQPDRRLHFARHLFGWDTTVAYDLAARGQATLVTLSQDWLADRPYALMDYWSLVLENLRGWVERQAVGARCDFSAQPHGTVNVDVDIAAAPHAVFEALIRPDQIDRYIAAKAIVEPQVGGRYDYGWDHGPVKILELAPDQKLSYSWGTPSNPETIVSWTLEGSGGRTHLTLVHSGFTSDPEAKDYLGGWSKFANRIKFMVEGGAGWQKPMFVEPANTMF
jgi:uncharacterized protein YndB with AHSA1/START domain